MRSNTTALKELPTENLRLNVGVKTSAANFLEGFNSAQRVMEVFGLHPIGLILDWDVDLAER